MKVSVCMITYNQEQFIAQAIESVLAQETDFNYELVIGEDCSTDRTQETCIAYQTRQPDKIRLLLRDKNLGMMQNFVQTYYACPGEYVAILDGDDYWTSPHKLQKQVDLLEKHSDYAICFTGALPVADQGHDPRYLPSLEYRKETLTIEDLLQCNFIASCSVLFRNHLFGAFPDWFFSLKMADWPLYIMNAQHGKIGYIDEVMAAYRIHRGGGWSSSDYARNLGELLEAYANINAHLGFKYNALIRAMRAKCFYDLSAVYESRGNLSEARRLAIKCVTESLFNKQVPVQQSVKMLLRLYIPPLYNLGKKAVRLVSGRLHRAIE